MFDSFSAPRRILAIYSLATLPLIIGFFALFVGAVTSPVHIVTAVTLVTILWAWGAYQLVELCMTQLRTLSSLVESARVGDYSMRGARASADDDLGELHRQINRLMLFLSERRQHLFGYEQLIEKALHDLDVGIFVFDGDYRLKMVNPAAASLLGAVATEVTDKHARELGLLPLLKEEGGVKEFKFAAGNGPWQIRKDRYRSEGAEQTLIFVSDLTQVLRTEELNAWRRIIRVISHEVNNSLTPLVSIAQSLQGFATHIPDHAKADFVLGLQTVETRAKGLSEFIQRYATVAKLPSPNLVQVDLADVIARVYGTLSLARPVLRNNEAMVHADAHQLEQALINLVKNAVEANQLAKVSQPPTSELIVERGRVLLQIKDQGLGIKNAANLFVPFYTTKQGGSGIGLTLARQIVEANGGSISLDNRPDGGCQATLNFALHHAHGHE